MDSQLNRGILEYCVLLTLKNGINHGYEISKKLSQYFDNLLDSTVYSIIRRLEKNGYIKTVLVKKEAGHNKKEITLLNKGMELCENYKKELDNLIETVNKLR